jgi:protein involved in polysaccharide export with SLBB domain
VAGMKFNEFRDYISNKITKESVGSEVSVTLGRLRSIRVFVLGEAYSPGSYSLSSLSTVTNAIIFSGGVKEIGSLRNVFIKRNGELIKSFDLYDVLLKGSTQDDIRLLPGDVIFIPVVGPQAGIKGGVKRPGIYELKKENSLSEIIELAGGFWKKKEVKYIKIYTNDESGKRLCKTINLSDKNWEETKIKNNDYIVIPYISRETENTVKFSGNVFAPGVYQYFNDMALQDILRESSQLKTNSDIDYGLILRESSRFGKLKALSFTPEKILNGNENVKLKPNDEIFIFPKSEKRQNISEEIIRKIKLRNFESDEYFPVVKIIGNVFFEGDYPLAENDTINELLKKACGLKPDTDLNYSVLARKNKESGDIDVYNLNLAKDLDFEIYPEDSLYVFSKRTNRPELLNSLIEKIKAQGDKENFSKVVSISGQIRFPGSYPLSNEMTVQNLIEYSGGFLEGSFVKYCEITRYMIGENDEFQIKRHRINLQGNYAPAAEAFYLKPKDKVVIKTVPEWRDIPSVQITGEVNFPGVYFIENDDTISSLVELAGGLTENAFKDGCVYMREDLRKMEQQRYDAYVDQLSAQLGTRRLKEEEGRETAQADAALLSIIEKLKNAKPSGRLVIDLEGILTGNKKDINLKDGDHLHIPMYKDEVTVMGEVFSPVSHIYEKGMELFDFIDSSGGVTESAAVKRIYTIRANGKVVPYKTGRKLIFSSKNTEVFPGDTIVVPYDVTAVSSLVFWGDVTKILYQLSTSAAALSAVGVF